MTTETAGAVDAGAAIVLDDDEQELMALELGDLLASTAGAQRYGALAASVDTGEVPLALGDVLASVLEFTLQTGRARGLYTAEGERILTGLYRRTPTGRAADAQLRAVNSALRALVGQPLDGVRVGMRTVGHHTLALSTGAGQVTLAIRPDGVEIHSVVPGGAPS